MFNGRIVAKYCSSNCRVRAHRTERANSLPPVEMMGEPRWVRHFGKVPQQVNGRAASSTNPATWTTYAAASSSTHGDGVGFVLNGDGIACVDLDHCLNGRRVEPWAAEILARCPRTYVEVSPSGTGLHVFGLATVGHGWRRGQVEAYDRGRYMTVTGKRFSSFPRVLADISEFVSLL